ncbi:GILT-like protein 1 [Eumeta japonica]|uniref:GILT-like protein 1 n=1 Tax=Eumeta variegata TaxID=151549 RepID=A0A4C1VEE4_EUMVA|nr:GILT-like protein 1 [Eumeta japonica]
MEGEWSNGRARRLTERGVDHRNSHSLDAIQNGDCYFTSGFYESAISHHIVTTAGCSDTVWFIRDQLVPTYQLYGQFLDVEFIPWGRTVRNLDGSLTCQFGNPDCWANRVHRCALHFLGDDQDAKMRYMGCEFPDMTNRPAFNQGSLLCGLMTGVNLYALDRCANTFFGEPLDKINEVAATVPMAIINFVPAVYINDRPDSNEWVNIFLNFREVICRMLAEDPSTGVTNC